MFLLKEGHNNVANYQTYGNMSKVMKWISLFTHFGISFFTENELAHQVFF